MKGTVMQRRVWLKTGAGLAAGLAATKMNYLHALEKVSEKTVDQDAIGRYRSQIGIQLYTLRGEISKDVKATIRAVADAGYKQVEPYGFPNADEMIEESKRCGMSVNSSHFAWDSVIDPSKGCTLL